MIVTKMFLWRIASNVMPTKQNLANRMGEMETWCPLCQVEQESITHLFCHCPVAKVIWFSQCWGILSDKLNASNHEELISLIINPPLP